jgi:transposase
MDELHQKISKLEALLEAAMTRIGELEAKGKQDSGNSLWLKACPKCGKTTRGQMPTGVPDGAFGPQLQARIGLLSGRYRLTRRETRSLAKDLFGVHMSLGSVQVCCNTVSAAVAEPAQTIHTEVKLAPEVHVDETGFGRCGKDRMWLWVAATEDAEAFRLLPGRGREPAKDLLGDGFSGLIHRDGWKPYEVFKTAVHQVCHSHIRRDFQSMLKLASDRAFHLWHQFERNEISRDGAVPSNDHAERSIRKAVLWRKVSLGADSEGGCRFVERMLTVAGTARKRGVDLLDWLARALQAKIHQLPAPSFRG